MAFELILAVVLVAANGFFVGTEFAVARLRPSQAHELVAQGRPGAKSALHAVEHIDSYLSACQLGITLSSLGLGAIGEPAFHDLLKPVLGEGAVIGSFGLATVVAFAVITTLHVVLGELAPKSAAISRTVSTVLVMAPLMRAFYLATKPVVDLFNGMGNLVLKPFGVPPASEAGSQPHSEEELRELLRESGEQGLIDSDESRMSEAALVFGDATVESVMRPRAEIDTVASSDDIRAIAARAVETGRTRLPVVPREGELEDATGVVNAKDLLPLLLEKGEGEVEAPARPLIRVQENDQIGDVLPRMRADRQHVALVADEHGTIVGLITLEDVIEQLVGDISDEFDAEVQR
jgi:CBS domain containing-hemolysin-like protein